MRVVCNLRARRAACNPLAVQAVCNRGEAVYVIADRAWIASPTGLASEKQSCGLFFGKRSCPKQGVQSGRLNARPVRLCDGERVGGPRKRWKGLLGRGFRQRSARVPLPSRQAVTPPPLGRRRNVPCGKLHTMLRIGYILPCGQITYHATRGLHTARWADYIHPHCGVIGNGGYTALASGVRRRLRRVKAGALTRHNHLLVGVTASAVSACKSGRDPARGVS